jgi:hypothetical protein
MTLFVDRQLLWSQTVFRVRHQILLGFRIMEDGFHRARGMLLYLVRATHGIASAVKTGILLVVILMWHGAKEDVAVIMELKTFVI